VLFDEKENGTSSGEVSVILILWFVFLYLSIYLLAKPIRSLIVRIKKRNQYYEAISLNGEPEQQEAKLVESPIKKEEIEMTAIGDLSETNLEKNTSQLINSERELRDTRSPGLTWDSPQVQKDMDLDSEELNSQNMIVINAKPNSHTKLNLWGNKVYLSARDCLQESIKSRSLELNLKALRFIKGGCLFESKLFHFLKLISYIRKTGDFDTVYLFNLDKLTVLEQILISEGLKSSCSGNTDQNSIELAFVVSDLDRVVAPLIKLVNQTKSTQNYRVLFKKLKSAPNSFDHLPEKEEFERKVFYQDILIAKNQEIYRILRNMNEDGNFNLVYSNLLVVRH